MCFLGVTEEKDTPNGWRLILVIGARSRHHPAFVSRVADEEMAAVMPPFIDMID